MPPKTKRQLQAQIAASYAKRRFLGPTSSSNPEDSEVHPNGSDQTEVSSSSDGDQTASTDSSEAMAIDQTGTSSSRDRDQTVSINSSEIMASYSQEWISSLGRDNQLALSIFLHYVLVNDYGIQSTPASEQIGHYLGVSGRTVREWKSAFFENEGSFPTTLQGKYPRSGVLWSEEKLNKKATEFIRQNASVPGRPNLTASLFCKWVNSTLLPGESLAPCFPRNISVETARKWMHELGFSVIDKKKGTFVDGHERPDVVEYRKAFLRKMIVCGMLTPGDAPTDEVRQSFPTDIEAPTQERASRIIIIFHDESIFHANDDETVQWGTEDQRFVRPKSKGAGLMVSDFIEETGGYLGLTDQEYQEAKQQRPGIQKSARVIIEYGENKEGYFTSERFLDQLEMAVEIAEYKYPRRKGYRLYFVFDQSSCHMAYAEDALNVEKMNKNPGGAQPKLRDTIYNGKAQGMQFRDGTPKGLSQVLSERGVRVTNMTKDEMKEILRNHPDFKNEKTKVEWFLHDRKHACIYLPKFHCELNPIERVWGLAKRYTRAYCNYSMQGLKKTVPAALASVTLENIQKFFRKSRDYMYAYLQGMEAGKQLILCGISLYNYSCVSSL